MRRSFFFTTAAALLVAATGCSDDGNESDDEAITSTTPTIDLLKSVPVDTNWADLDSKIKKKLDQNAKKALKEYEKRWSFGNLSKQADELISTDNAEAVAAFDAFVSSVYGQFLTDAAAFKASESMNSELRHVLQRLYVVRIAAWRLNVRNYANMAATEADGVTKIDEFALPSEKAIKAYEHFASDAIEELSKIDPAALSTEERAIADRALSHLRQHRAGSSGFNLGTADFASVWGRGSWAYDVAWAHSAEGGGFMQDDQKYAEIVNAYYLAPVAWVNVGTSHALNFLVDPLADPGFVEATFGAGPESSAAAKAYVLLTRWFTQRVQSSSDATKHCSIYSAAKQADMWDAFSADNLFNNDGKSTFDDFKNDASDAAVAQLGRFKEAVVGAIQAYGAEAALSPAQIQAVVAAVQAETKYGGLIDTAAAALDTAVGGTTAGTAFRAHLTDIPKIGGGYTDADTEAHASDVAAVQQAWVDVKSFLDDTYGIDTSALQDQMDVKVLSGSGFTDQDGKITISVKLERTEDSIYSTLLHETHHSINARAAVHVEGPAWEGAAKTVESEVFPSLMAYVLAKRGTPEKAPYYLATNQGSLNTFLAKTQATIEVLSRKSCGGPDTIEFAENIGKSWGITDPARLDDVAIRSHHGPSYFQYTAGEILYTSFLQFFSDALGQPVDPFTMQSCGLTFAPQTPATVNALKSCLGLP